MYLLIWKKGQNVKTFNTKAQATLFQQMSSLEDAQLFLIEVEPTQTKSVGTGDVERGLKRLMYLSKAKEPDEITPSMLTELAQQSSTRNKEIGISGYLLYSAPFFFQVLEGNEEDLDFLFAKINQDERHDRSIVLSHVPCLQRLYGDWHMKDSHIDNITNHPAIKTILYQIATSFSCMWSYLPKVTAAAVLRGENPADSPPQPMSAVICYLTFVGATELLENEQTNKQMVDILQAFTNVCAQEIESRGGSVARFHTTYCIAYFPINAADQCLEATHAIQSECAEIRRRESSSSALSQLYVRAGVHYGRVLLCNAGTSKSDFTLLGNDVNVAYQLLHLAERQDQSMLFSFEVKCLLSDEAREQMLSMGTHQVKGCKKPVVVYSMPGQEYNTDQICQRISNMRGHGYQPTHPIYHIADVDPSERAPLFDEWIKSEANKRSTERRNSLVNQLMQIARFAFEPGALDAKGISGSSHVTLTYISVASWAMSPLDLQNIQHQARRKNAQHHITGCILYVSGIFVQTLEGPKEPVLNLYTRICADPRHKDIVTVHLAKAEERVYPFAWNSKVSGQDWIDAFPPLQEVMSQLAKSFMCLERFVPPPIVRHLQQGNNPAYLKPVQTDLIMVASDIVSFTQLTEKTTLLEVWTICNSFMDAFTAAVKADGGEVLKLIGDCVTAYFPGNAADAALSAAQEFILFIGELRDAFSDVSDVRSYVHCGVGIDFGPCIMAPVGSTGVTEFTAVSTAASRVIEVEAHTREVGRAILLTSPVAELLPSNVSNSCLELCPQPFRGGIEVYALTGDEFGLDVRAIRGDIAELNAKRAGQSGHYPTFEDYMPPTPAAVPVQAPATFSPPPQQARQAFSESDSDRDLSPEEEIAEIYMSGCQIRGAQPSKTVIKRLQEGVTTDCLDIAGLCSSRAELMPVLASIKTLHLKSCNLANNQIDDASLCDVIDTLMTQQGLTMLDISGNRKVSLVTGLKRLLKQVPTLRTLKVDGCNLPPSEVRALTGQEPAPATRTTPSSSIREQPKREVSPVPQTTSSSIRDPPKRDPAPIPQPNRGTSPTRPAASSSVREPPKREIPKPVARTSITQLGNSVPEPARTTSISSENGQRNFKYGAGKMVPKQAASQPPSMMSSQMSNQTQSRLPERREPVQTAPARTTPAPAPTPAREYSYTPPQQTPNFSQPRMSQSSDSSGGDRKFKYGAGKLPASNPAPAMSSYQKPASPLGREPSGTVSQPTPTFNQPTPAYKEKKEPPAPLKKPPAPSTPVRSPGLTPPGPSTPTRKSPTSPTRPQGKRAVVPGAPTAGSAGKISRVGTNAGYDHLFG